MLKEYNKIPVILFIAAVIIRILYVINIDIPPWNDMIHYDNAALSILDGGLGKSYEFIAQPPLYPLFLAGIFGIFGHSYLAVRLIQAVLSAVSCVVFYFTGKEMINKRIGILAGVIAVVYPDLISFTGILMAETLSIFIFSILIYCIAKNKSPFLTGLIYGLLILTKGLYLLVLPGLMVWLLIRQRQRISVILKFLLCTGLVVLPWMIRNYMVYKKFMITTGAGIAVYVGHNPSADGGCNYKFTEHEYGRFYTDSSLTVFEKNSIALKKSFEYIIANPVREAALVFLKFGRYWSLKTHFDFYAQNYPLQNMFFYMVIMLNALLYPACFVGIFILLKRKNYVGWGLSIIILNFTLIFCGLFSAFGRMSLPIVPFIIIVAAFGFNCFYEKIKLKDVKSILNELILAVLVSGYIYVFFICQVMDRYDSVVSILKH